MLLACLPLGPCVTSKLTFWPSFRVLKPFILIAEKWANRSSPPPSGVMKPKPFASLNHFTVPVAIAGNPLPQVLSIRERCPVDVHLKESTAVGRRNGRSYAGARYSLDKTRRALYANSGQKASRNGLLARVCGVFATLARRSRRTAG